MLRDRGGRTCGSLLASRWVPDVITGSPGLRRDESGCESAGGTVVPTGTVGVEGVGPIDWGTCEAVGSGVVCDGDRCGSGSLSEDMLDEVSDELEELSTAIGSTTGCSSLLT